jgi:hypothetical protein
MRLSDHDDPERNSRGCDEAYDPAEAAATLTAARGRWRTRIDLEPSIRTLMVYAEGFTETMVTAHDHVDRGSVCQWLVSVLPTCDVSTCHPCHRPTSQPAGAFRESAR